MPQLVPLYSACVFCGLAPSPALLLSGWDERARAQGPQTVEELLKAKAEVNFCQSPSVIGHPGYPENGLPQGIKNKLVFSGPLYQP